MKSSLLFRVLTQNIFLTDNATIKLGDFGSACILNRYGNREATICSLLLSLCSVLDLLLSHFNCVAAQSPTRMHMLGRRIMWLQKSGTTSHTTIRGILPSCLSNWFLLYMAQDQMKHLVAKPYCGGSNESFKNSCHEYFKRKLISEN